MALGSFNAYIEACKVAPAYPFSKDSPTTTSGAWYSHWLRSPFAGATPSTAVIPNASTLGALLHDPNFGDSYANTQYLAQLELHCSTNAFSSLMFIDRLAHQGGLSGTVTTAQTTNLPTSALTRNTGGVGNQIGIEVYTAVGATATTLTCSYTNQAGTAGRTTKAIVFGGTGFNIASRFMTCPLQDGDTGVKSVESVTVLASTLTAGNFGVTIYKPLLIWPNHSNQMHSHQPRMFDALLGGAGCLSSLPGNACIQMLSTSNTTGTGTVAGYMKPIEVA